MPTSNYPFLARNQKTEEERQRDNVDALWNQLGVIGNQGNRSFFTGYGEDNQLQPERPTGILNTNQGPRTVHEAERVDISPNGEFSVTPASQVGGQENLQRIEEEKNIRGYQFGTDDEQTNSIVDTDITDTYKPYMTRGLQRLERYADYESPVNKAIREGERERFAGEAVAAKGAQAQELAQMGVEGREAAVEEARLGRQIGAQESALMADLRKQESEQAFTAARQLPGEAATARGMDIAAQQWQQEFAFDKEKYGDTKAWTDFEYTAQYGSDQDVMDAYKAATGKDLDPAAVAEVRGYARTKRAQDVTAGYLENLATEYGISNNQMEAIVYAINNGATREMVNERFGMDFTPEQFERISEGYEQRIEAGFLENLATRYGIGNTQMAAIVYAINNGATRERVNEEFGMDFTPEEFNRIAQGYEQTIEAGNIANTAALVGVTTDTMSAVIDEINNGTPLSVINRMFPDLNLTPDERDSIAAVYDTNLASIKNAVGNEMYQTIQTMINSGATIEMVNDRLLENGMRTLGEDEYQSMLDATPLGDRNWGRKMAAANVLLSSPGMENKIKAEEVYDELFPTISFGQVFEGIANEEQYENFADGLALMAGYVAAGMDYDEAYALLQSGGAADKMGIDATFLKSIYESMEINAIDEQWEEMENSDFFRSLTPEEQEQQREFFKQWQMGELDYTMLNEYNIYNPDGTLNMTVYGKDSSEADKKAASLGEGYTVEDTGKVKFQAASTLTTGTTDIGEKPINEAYNDFVASIPADENIPIPPLATWEAAGKPEKWEEYRKEETPLQGLDAIDVESYTELLTRDNSKVLFDAFDEDAQSVRDSEYYYKLPDNDDMVRGITWELVKNKIQPSVSSETRRNIENSMGKIIEIPYTDTEGKVTTYTGQLTDLKVKDWEMTVTIKDSEGKEHEIPIVRVNEAGSMAMINGNVYILGGSYQAVDRDKFKEWGPSYTGSGF